MKSGRAAIWLLTASAISIAAVQLHHQGFISFNMKRAPFVSVSLAPKHHAAQRGLDQKGTVTVFGHEFSESQVGEWFTKVDGRYCYKDGIIYAANTAPGYPLTYDQFVYALKQGYHFPELKGEGVRSDGERVILQHESPFAKENTTAAKVTVAGRPVGH